MEKRRIQKELLEKRNSELIKAQKLNEIADNFYRYFMNSKIIIFNKF